LGGIFDGMEAGIDEVKLEERRREAVAKVEKLLRDGQTSMLKVVESLGHLLTSDSSHQRVQGMMVLADMLESALENISGSELEHIVTFLCERMKDWHTLRPTLRACKILLGPGRDAAIPGDLVNKVVRSFFETIDVQSHSQSNRQLCFEIIELVLVHRPGSFLRLEDPLDILVSFVDGEKDPRCLLIAFSSVAKAVAVISREDGKADLIPKHAENLADVLSCYFPLSFTPPPDNVTSVTRADLLDHLYAAYSSTSHFLPHVIQLLEDRLPSPKSETKVEGLALLKHCLLKSNKEAIAPLLDQIWAIIRSQAFPSGASADIAIAPNAVSESSVTASACECVQTLSRLMDSKEDAKVLNTLFEEADVEKAMQSWLSDKKIEDDEAKHERAMRFVSIVAGSSEIALEGTAERTLPMAIRNLTLQPEAIARYVGHVAFAGMDLVEGDTGVKLPVFRSHLSALCEELLSVLSGEPVVEAGKGKTALMECFRALVRLCKLPKGEAWVEASVASRVVVELSRFILNESWSTTEEEKKELATGIAAIYSKYMQKEVVTNVVDEGVVELSDNRMITSVLLTLSVLAKRCEDLSGVILEKVVDYCLAALQSKSDAPKDGDVLTALTTIFKAISSDIMPHIHKHAVTSLAFAGTVVGKLCALLRIAYGGQVQPFIEDIVRSISSCIALCLKVEEKEGNTYARDVVALLLECDSDLTCFPEMKKAELRPEFRCLLASAVLTPLHCVNGISNIDDVMHVFVENVMETEDDAFAKLVSVSLSSIINKLDSDMVDSLAMPSVQVLLNHLCSCDERHAISLGFGCLVWVSRALAMRKHECYKEVEIQMLDLLTDAETEKGEGAKDYKVGLGRSLSQIIVHENDALLQSWHWKSSFLWRQKLFTSLFEKVMDLLKAGPSPPTRIGLFQLFSCLLSSIPRNISKPYMSLGGVAQLIGSIEVLAESPQKSEDTLQSNIRLLNETLGDGSMRDLMQEHVRSTINCLLASCKVGSPRAHLVRKEAIICITQLKGLPHYCIYPYLHSIRRQLQALLDDPKRDVRLEAGRTLRLWIDLLTS